MKPLDFNFSIGDKNKNGKIDVSFALSVYGVTILSKTKDVSLSVVGDLVGAGVAFVGTFGKKVK